MEESSQYKEIKQEWKTWKRSSRCSGCKVFCVRFPLELCVPVRAPSERTDIHYPWCRGGGEDYLTAAGLAGVPQFADIKIHLPAVDQSLARVSISTLWQMFSIFCPSLSVTRP